jgi:hypothetical protein
MEKVDLAMGAVLGGTVKMIITPYGGFSLDVDDEEDFRVLSLRFDDWF